MSPKPPSIGARTSREAAGQRRIAIAAGGTAGHVYPALAIAEAFAELFGPSADLLFLGTNDGFEAKLVPEHGYRFEAVRALPFQGVSRKAKLRSVLTVPAGVEDARRVMRAHGSRLLLGLGGTASAGPVLAARGMGLRVAILEPNAVPGLANLLLARLAHRIYVGCEEALRELDRSRAVVTGNPVRASIRRVERRPHGGPMRLLVTGGSLGASFLDERVPGLAAQLAKHGLEVEVHHLAGRSDPDEVRARYAAAGVRAEVDGFIDDMASAYARADFAIARSGASTLAELAATGLPALLVPLPNHARDHQLANARAREASGGAWIVDEARWSEPEIADRLAALLRDAPELKRRSDALRANAPLAAAEAIARDAEGLMLGRW